ncbi:MAG: hypothetical protein CL569_20015 [Alphaproteobacteria bacterium]|nr:hypothetical protein [Alphaproteobacteria bacterium]
MIIITNTFFSTQPIPGSRRLTMTVAHDLEGAQTEEAMRILERLVPDALNSAGPGVRSRFDNAVLNIAVNRIVEVEGGPRTATILMRLAEVIAQERRPVPGTPIDLTRLDG